jgi:hypothetical protein
VLPLLSVLIDFVDLKGDAADVSDSLVEDEDSNVRRIGNGGTS